MATVTEVLAATTAADTSVTFDIDAGSKAVFAAFGLAGADRVVVEIVNDGSTYQPLKLLSSSGLKVSAQMDRASSTVSLAGPLKGRLNKEETAGSVQIVSYT